MHTLHHIEVVMNTMSVRGFNALCIAFAFCLLTPLARAQPHTTIRFPANAQSGVATDASIVLSATHPIVPPTITHAWPDEEASGWRAEEPTVLLVDASKCARMPREKWSRAAIMGSYTFDDPRTLRFTPRVPLRMGITYRCVIDGIRLTTPDGNVSTVPHEFEFTTTTGVPTISKSTFDSGSVVHCNQSLYINFSTIDAGTLADAATRIRITVQDELGQDIHVPYALLMHHHISAVEIRPHGRWPLQRPMTVALPWGEVTGDHHDSKTWGVVARGAATLAVQAVSADGRAIPEGLRAFYSAQSQVLVSGERATIVSPPWFDDRWRFVGWASPNISSADKQSTLALDVTLPCELLSDRVHLNAIVERVDTMRVVVKLDGGGTVTILDSANAVISELSETDTIMLTDDLPRFSIAVSASAGHVFSGWQAPNTALHGVSVGTIVITPQALANQGNAGNSPQAHASQNSLANTAIIPHVQPNFPVIPITPGSESFKLRAQLADVDREPAFDVEDGVVFTTPQWFEEGTQVERTPCIRAERCWEILSVDNAGDRGGNQQFAAGTAEACETAWLTDPENVVTFSVRRRRIQLRVERVLLASDNADDIIAGRHLHPESYVIVDRQVGPEGAQQWRPLSSATCVTADKIEFNTYEVRCGDLVRFRIRGSDVRGEKWKFWANIQSYGLPGAGDVVGDETHYTMVIDRDIAQFAASDCTGKDLERQEVRVRACFRQQFGIDALGLRVRLMTPSGSKASSTFREIWVDPLVYYDQVDDEPIDGRQLEYIPLFGTVLRVKFTTPIDVRTVFAEGMKAYSYSNINVNSPRSGNLDFTVKSFDDEHISFAPVDGSPIDIVEFRVCDPTTSPRKQALHFGNITLYCSTTLKSLSGEALPARFSFLLNSMERPGYGLFLHKAKWSHDGDNDFWPFTNYAELYNVLYGAVLTPTAAQHAELGFQRLPDCREQQGIEPSECVYKYTDDDGYFGFSDRTLLFEPSWLGDRDYVFSHIVSYDEDCKDNGDCLVNNVYALLDAVREKTAGYQPSAEEKSEGITWENVVPDLIDLGAQFIQALLPVDDQDEFIGTMSLLESASDLWGAAESTAPYAVRYHDNGEYVYKVRLYPRRQLRF